MFGGLELKGNDSKDEETAAPAPAPAAASAFGFLNATSTSGDEDTNAAAVAAPEPAATPSSGFSFLNPSAPAPEPAPAASSGFSFLQAATTASEPTPPTPDAAAIIPPSAQDSPATEAESAFSFLMSTTTPAHGTPAPALAPESASSGFDFLMSTTATTPGPAAMETPAVAANIEDMPVVAPPEPTSLAAARNVSIGSTSVASSVTTPSLMDASAPTPSISSSLPAGAGITFGTAAKRGGVKKKKSRAARVGMGATAVTPISPSKRQQPAPAPAPAPTQVPEETEESKASSARDEAEAAALRAEEFMSKKSVEHSNQVEDPLEILAAPSSDSVLQAAEKAAHEAKSLAKQQQNQRQQKGSGFMGTFFKGFSGSQPSSQQTRGSASSQNSSNSVDRLANKQKDMKRAAAERQMTMQHQQQESTAPEDDKADGEVAVSTRAAGTYSPEPIPVSQAMASDILIPASFQPAKPPLGVQELKPTPPAPPVQKKQKTPNDVFEEYQALFAQSVHKAMESVENVRSTQKMLLEERFVAMAKQNLSTQQIKQIEAQLQVAVEDEDYELADQLGQVAEAHKREKQEVSMMLDANFKALEHLDSQKDLVVQGVASCFQNLAVRMAELQEKESVNDHSPDSESFKQFQVTAKQLSAEKERLQQDAKHLERDEQLVAEERKELEVAISEQSGVLETQRDDTKKKLSEVEREIEDLRKQLEQKQKVAAGLRTEMHGFEDSIDKVRVKFSRQLTRVDKKERALKENRNEFEAEQATFERHKKGHELKVQSHSEAMLLHDELMKKLETELKLTKEFAEMIPAKVGFLEVMSEEKDANDAEEGNLAQLQADVVKCEAAVSEAKIVLKAATGTITSLESELATLAASIPQLEAHKKSAAASRDFKAASKASKEIKDATSRLKECQEELVGDAADRKNAAKEEVDRLDEELTKTRKVADEKEKLSAQRKMKAVAAKIENLVETKKELCGSASSSDNSVRGVGAMVLEGQIKSLKMEGETLGEKFGGWEELMGVEGDNVEAEPGAAAEEATPAPVVDDGLTSRERIMKVRDLLQRIQDAEESLEAAAAAEDFDRAAELHEVFQSLQSEFEKINLSEEETEIAMGDGELPEEPAAEECPGEEPPTVSESSVNEPEDDSPTEPDPEQADEHAPAAESDAAEEDPGEVNEAEPESEEAEENGDIVENGDDELRIIEAKPSEDSEMTNP